jgi:pSer/pThr/pTyr-binding forkhead associated (FHA) protein
VTIGRSSQSDIHIDDVSVSTDHAVILVAPSEFLDGHNDILIEDLQSQNGTLVNGQPVHRCQLNPDDVITIGFNKFKLLDDRAAGRESTVLMMMD